MLQRMMWLLVGCLVLISDGIVAAQSKTGTPPAAAEAGKTEPAIDFDKAYKLFQRRKGGEKLTAEDNAYVERALEARKKANGQPGAGQPGAPTPSETVAS